MGFSSYLKEYLIRFWSSELLEFKNRFIFQNIQGTF